MLYCRRGWIGRKSFVCNRLVGNDSPLFGRKSRDQTDWSRILVGRYLAGAVSAKSFWNPLVGNRCLVKPTSDASFRPLAGLCLESGCYTGTEETIWNECPPDCNHLGTTGRWLCRSYLEWFDRSLLLGTLEKLLCQSYFRPFIWYGRLGT